MMKKNLIISCVLGYVVLNVNDVTAASRYWDCISSTWDNSACWSTTADGTGATGLPLAGDNIYLLNPLSNSNKIITYRNLYNPGSIFNSLTLDATGFLSSITFSQNRDIFNTRYEYVGQNGSGTVNLTGGAHNVSNNLYLGNTSTGRGTFSVSNTGVLTTNQLIAGNSGTGTLNVQNGGTVNSGVGYLGYVSGGSGTATINGPGSTWTSTSNIISGVSGTGVLNVQNGATVSSSYGTIGSGSTGNGTATVKDANSTWNVTNTMVVGNSGIGTMNIQSGGVVSDTTGYVGRYSGSAGRVSVDGLNTSWANSGNLYIGDAGTGELLITNGGNISSASSIIGNTNNVLARGDAEVNGTGSLFTSVDLTVGNAGAGTLLVKNQGALATSGLAVIGNTVTGQGTVTVDGIDSFWEYANDGTIVVGEQGNGTLNIINGGRVGGYRPNLSSIVAASGAGSTGTINLVGTGSYGGIWSDGSTINANSMTIGDYGTANLSITNKGKIDSQLTIGGAAGGIGTVSLNDSQLRSTILNVGLGGYGSFVADGSSNVSLGNIDVGINQGSEGYVTFDGTTISSSSGDLINLDIGDNGYGVVTFQNGAQIASNNRIDINIGDFGDTGHGILNITSGARVMPANSFTVGSTVFNSEATVGGKGLGQVYVSGANSSWATDVLRLGTDGSNQGLTGTGQLVITDGGYVEVSDLRLASEQGDHSIVSVDGVGSWFDYTGVPATSTRGLVDISLSNGGKAHADLALYDSSNININSGSILYGNDLRIGSGLAKSSAINVDGAGSLLGGNGSFGTYPDGWSTNGLSNLLLGSGEGDVSLRVTNGGTVNAFRIEADGNTVIDVDGVGSRIYGNGSITLGSLGNAALNISAGAEVSVVNRVDVAKYSGGTASINVNGIGSRLVSNNLNIGGSSSISGGSGSVVVENNASMVISGLTKIWEQGSLILKSGADFFTDTLDVLNAPGGAFEYQDSTLRVANVQGSLINGDFSLLKHKQTPGSYVSNLLSISENYTQSDLATLELQLWGGQSTTVNYHSVNVGGTANLAGTLDTILQPTYQPFVEDTFDLLTAENIVGAFDSASFGVLRYGFKWQLDYLADEIATTDVVRLSVVPDSINDKYWACGTDVWDVTCWSLTPGGLPSVGQPTEMDRAYLVQNDATDRTVNFQNTLFPLDTLYDITVNATSTGNMTFEQIKDSLNAHFITIGDSGSGNMYLSGGTQNLTYGLVAGKQASGNGNAVISNSGILNADYLTLGENGAGILTIENGGTVNSQNAFIGKNSGASGNILVNGSGTSWNNGDTLIVGDAGNGLLEIRNQGLLTSVDTVLGNKTGADGSAIIDGVGSIWNSNGNLAFGRASVAGIASSMVIQNGGTVNSFNTTMTATTGSTSAAVVDGAGSAWNNSGLLSVYSKEGDTITIQNGGALQTNNTVVSSDSTVSTGAEVNLKDVGSVWNSNGDLVLTGAQSEILVQNNSLLNSTGLIEVTNSGNLLVQNAGLLSTIGANTINGKIVVDGIGSIWNDTGAVAVNRTNSSASSTNGIEVLNGGVFNSNDTVVRGFVAGAGSSYRGKVMIRDAGSTWNSTGLLEVGQVNAPGEVLITNGGTLNSQDVALGVTSGDLGYMQLIGNGTKWINKGRITLGSAYGGNGQVWMADGAAVINEGVTDFGSNSSLLVLGAGTSFSAQGQFLTSGSNGGIDIADGGAFQTTDFAGAGGVQINIDNAGTSWVNTGNIELLGKNLNVTRGANVNFSAVGNTAIDEWSVVTVDGTASSFESNRTISLGKDFEGTLNIQNGGQVILNNGLLIGGDGFGALPELGNGIVNLTGGKLKADSIDASHDKAQFNFTGGRLVVDTFTGDLVNNGGTLAPGDSPGLTTINGNYIQSSSGILEIEIGGLLSGTEYDLVDVTGIATLGGILDVSLFDWPSDGLGNPFSPVLGDSFDILMAETIAGEFDLFTLALLGNGLAWDVNYILDDFGTDFVQLNVISAVPVPATVWLFGSGLLGLIAVGRRKPH